MRAARLRRTTDVQRVRREGVSRSDRFYRLSALPTSSSETRLAIAVGARLGTAVVRNRARRRARAAFARAAQQAHAGADLLVSVRQAAIDAAFADLERSAGSLLAEVGLLGVSP
jgi:ribonuclease P protein component